MPNGERPMPPEMMEVINETKLTPEELNELKKLRNDPDVLKYKELQNPFSALEKDLDEAAEEAEEFLNNTPGLKEKIDRLNELEAKSKETVPIIKSGF